VDGLAGHLRRSVGQVTEVLRRLMPSRLAQVAALGPGDAPVLTDLARCGFVKKSGEGFHVLGSASEEQVRGVSPQT
jgi:hypothetical protein